MIHKLSSVAFQSKALFSSIDSLAEAIRRADANATQEAKIKITTFLRTDPNIPRKTGRMIESAVSNLLRSGLTGELDLNILFSVIYASIIEEEDKFIEKIIGKITDIVKEAIYNNFSANGLEVSVY